MFYRIKRIKEILGLLIEDVKYTLSFLKMYDFDQEVIFSKLRTSVHVLDKGIYIVPFEKGHGTAIYRKCIDLKQKIKDESILSDKSFQWACSVIEEYEKKQKEVDENTNPEKNKKVSSTITKDEKELFYEIIKNRTSCRNYLSEEIPDEVWNEIVSIAEEAPSGCCRQPSRYYIESNQKIINELRKNIAGATGFSSPMPYLICVTSDTRAYEIIDRFSPIIDTSLSIENFLLACTANNISTTPLNWQHATVKEIKTVKKILNIPSYEKIILFIVSGYPSVIPQKPKRIDLKWIRKK